MSGGARVVSGAAVLAVLLAGTTERARAADAASDATAVVDAGATLVHGPTWPGGRGRTEVLPNVDVALGRDLEYSSGDGLTFDLLRGAYWHGGPHADWRAGRSRQDLATRGGALPPVRGAVAVGGYVAFDPSPTLEFGLRVAHDVGRPGASADLAASWDLPPLGLWRHSLDLRWRFESGASLRRDYGVTAALAVSAGLAPYDPPGGLAQSSVEYTGSLPIDRTDAITFLLGFERLGARAASGPIVRAYGARDGVVLGIGFVREFRW